jgi:hypothetical protein
MGGARGWGREGGGQQPQQQQGQQQQQQPRQPQPQQQQQEKGWKKDTGMERGRGVGEGAATTTGARIGARAEPLEPPRAHLTLWQPTAPLTPITPPLQNWTSTTCFLHRDPFPSAPLPLQLHTTIAVTPKCNRSRCRRRRHAVVIALALAVALAALATVATPHTSLHPLPYLTPDVLAFPPQVPSRRRLPLLRLLHGWLELLLPLLPRPQLHWPNNRQPWVEGASSQPRPVHSLSPQAARSTPRPPSTTQLHPLKLLPLLVSSPQQSAQPLPLNETRARRALLEQLATPRIFLF